MSLRVRLIAAMAAALMFTFALGAGLGALHARRSVRTELAGAMDNARATAEALAGGDARRLVASFDDGRHVRA